MSAAAALKDVTRVFLDIDINGHRAAYARAVEVTFIQNEAHEAHHTEAEAKT